MISEFAILPEVFRTAENDRQLEIRLCLSVLLDCLKREAVVRDLNHEWRKFLASVDLDLFGREIFEYLLKRNRIVQDAISEQMPTPKSEEEWLKAAVFSHKKFPLELIVSRDQQRNQEMKGVPFTQISNLVETDWWRNRPESVCVEPTLAGYYGILRKISRCDRKIIFIDPYANPDSPNYSDFPKLLGMLAQTNPYLFFEVHVAERGSETARCDAFTRCIRSGEWKGEFSLHIWKKFHHRYILSNLVGIMVPKGLESKYGGREPLIWTRLSETDRTRIYKQFDPVHNGMRYLKGQTFRAYAHKP